MSSQTATSGPVGIIGLGIMGGVYAQHLLKAGLKVVGFDVDAARVRQFVELGGQALPAANSVIEAAEVVIVALGAVSAYTEVMCGEGGLPDVARSGQLVIDTGTLPPALKLRARERLVKAGAVMLDAPVTGTRLHAERKELVIYASGDPDDIERARPTLSVFANDVRNVGLFGTGIKLKIVTNLLVAIHNVATAEALALAESAGLDLSVVHDLIASGPARSEVFNFRGPIMISGDYSRPTMRMDVFNKDVEIIAEFARSLKAATPLFQSSAQLYQAGLEQGMHGDDVSAVFKIVTELSGR